MDFDGSSDDRSCQFIFNHFEINLLFSVFSSEAGGSRKSAWQLDGLFVIGAGAEVEDGHAHDDAVGDLLQDH